MYNLRRKFYILCICFAIYSVLSLMAYSYYFSSSSDLDLNISRNLNDYINNRLSPHILPKKICSQKKLLLVIVCSRPDDIQLRKAIRETWGKKHDDVSFYFLFGEFKKNEQIFQAMIEGEQALFDDIIQERFIDSYNNLTLKSAYMLKVFNRYCYKSFKYLMKTDDDVFVNVPRVLQMLANRKENTNVILGRVRHGWPIRDPDSKWYVTFCENLHLFFVRYVPYEWYPEKEYPANVCGPGYIMSRDVAKKLYKCALNESFLNLEDVYLTGICAKKMNISLENSYLFTCNYRPSHFCYYKNFFTLHYYDAEEIVNAYEMLNTNYCNGFSKFDVTKPWTFFFNLF
ncbi:beta-1,3-galactosyltransferase 1-like [Tribolium madens]|uniref:beta-1,3-galactosyltransferase 1-like n=1 Tax=Tribolium madens TaxID=41895 RepID=UPI001CF724C3|nr:beta-1,3-galactosyltransferase 1-like [Tribolium madens]